MLFLYNTRTQQKVYKTKKPPFPEAQFVFNILFQVVDVNSQTRFKV